MAARFDVRPAEAADAARIGAWRAAPGAWGALSADPRLASTDMDGDEAADRQDWIVEADGAAVGLVSLYQIDRRNARVAFAAYVVEAAAGRAQIERWTEFWLLDYAFEGLKLAKAWCETPASDAGAQERHERFGFTREALFKGHLIRDGAAQDVLGFGMLAADWRARRADLALRLLAEGSALPEIA